MLTNLFTEKTILLTGASQGIGREIAFELASKGARLILISRNKNKLDLLKKELPKKDLEHVIISLDVSNSEEVKRRFTEIKKKINILHGIINCAGSFGPIGKLEEVNPSLFLDGIKVNLLGSYNICYYGLSLVKKNNRGIIINFSGGGATSIFPNYSAYACSKIALVKLTENLAAEYDEMDINIIAPGFIKSSLAEQTLNAGVKAGRFYYDTIEMLRNGGTDIRYTLELVNFLLSNDSKGISGKFISAPWDKWEQKLFINKLKSDKDFCSLRRIDNKYFQSIIPIK